MSPEVNRARTALALGPRIVAFALAACSASAPLQHGDFRRGNVAFHVGDAPAGWRQIHVSAADLAFRDDAREASVLVNGRCGKRDDDTPLRALTDHLILGTTERDIQKEETLTLDGREALHTIMSAKLDGVPMQYDMVVLKKDGCVYDFVLVAPPARFSEGAATFEAFVAGFHTIGSGAL